MRVVLDTNVWVSLALDKTGNFARLVKETNRRGVVFVSPFLLKELEGVLQKINWGGETQRTDFIEYVAGTTWAVSPSKDVPRVLKDGADNHILACAVLAEADTIVTGDKPFLKLGNYRGVEIVSPAEFLKQLGLN